MHCQQHVVLEVGVTNPTDAELTLEVTVEGHGLTGAPSFIIAAHAYDVYQVSFAPTAVGQYDGGSVEP